MRLSEKIKFAREEEGLTQQQLAELIGVQRGLVSYWETGRADPGEYLDELEDILGTQLQVGNLLREKRKERNLSVKKLAEQSGYSIGFIYNIENGNNASPNPETLRKLFDAVGVAEPELRQNDEYTEDEKQFASSSIGELYDVDLKKLDDVDGVPGIYVFWSAGGHPIYVGQSQNIAKRFKQHEDKFWFKEPVVSSMSYVQIEDEGLRKSVEKIILSILRDFVIVNRNY